MIERRIASRETVLILVLILGSCRAPREQTTVVVDRDYPPPSARVPADVERLYQLARDVQTAPSTYAEADSIKRLRRWMVDHDMTYTVHAYRSSNEQAIDPASVVREPVRADMEIFRGRERLYSFSFVPRDNQNLALLGS